MIIDCLVEHPDPTKEPHYNLDHDGIGSGPIKIRPHLALKDTCQRHNHRLDYSAKIPENPLDASWQEGLPTNPLLPLTLVSRTFRQCAQETLFNSVVLGTQWQALLFLRALRTPAQAESNLSGTGIDPSTAINHPSKPLAQLVRSLQFRWRGPASMGKGGGSVICDIIRSCPSLENVAIGITLLKPCQEPLLEALAGRTFLNEFLVLRNPYRHGEVHLQWKADEMLARLCSGWKHLETIELHKLAGQSDEMIQHLQKTIPILPGALKTIILERPNLDDREISWLLASSLESMQTLKIIEPTKKLTRPGLCRILKECTGPNLEILTIRVATEWEMIFPDEYSERSDDPATNRGLLDVVFKTSSALRKLKSLSFDWDDHDMDCTAVLEALSNSQENTSESHVQCLPNLKCCSIRSFYSWPKKAREVIKTAMEARGVCLHVEGGKDFLKNERGYQRGGSAVPQSLSDSEEYPDSAYPNDLVMSIFNQLNYQYEYY
ncbi:hypothetical protein PtA15_2A750 [Puccinia triticina]|uniref:F-box domain-containing protein n=1 Tax=Puccinia triticina TaxID=208348 RepID=A0ABY7CB69_9BASI|nr:uncharacterized protein PtA15_2A750 [Puccinia triticina]WAQ82433.1 hypothetical protein PtA15_2A750 [Puccinia triticina]